MDHTNRDEDTIGGPPPVCGQKSGGTFADIKGQNKDKGHESQS